MTARVTISLPEELLGQLDAIADAESLTRSDVVREAAGAYVTAHASGLQAARRQRAVDDGIAWLREIAAKPALDPRPTLEILREVRGEAGGEAAEGEQR
jgi:predicted transcriptional regulator